MCWGWGVDFITAPIFQMWRQRHRVVKSLSHQSCAASKQGDGFEPVLFHLLPMSPLALPAPVLSITDNSLLSVLLQLSWALRSHTELARSQDTVQLHSPSVSPLWGRQRDWDLM